MTPATRDVSVAAITGAAVVLPADRVEVSRDMDPEPLDRGGLEIPKLRAIDLLEVAEVPCARPGSAGELGVRAGRRALELAGLAGVQLDLIIDFSTVGREANGLSILYRVQDHLNATRAVTLAVGNGSCCGLQLALRTAQAYMAAEPRMRTVLLLAADVVEGRRYHPPLAVFGDGASAIVLERGAAGASLLGTSIVSRGRCRSVLGVHHFERGNFDLAAFENLVVPQHYRITHKLTSELLREHGLEIADVDVALTQNMSANDVAGFTGCLGIAPDRVTTCVRGHGHVFGSDLVINLVHASKLGKLRPGHHVLMASSGAGFSWGVSLLRMTGGLEVSA